MGLRHAEQVLKASDEHRIALCEVKLQVAQQHNVLGIGLGEQAIE